jgi:phospholipid-translocating ATPase
MEDGTIQHQPIGFASKKFSEQALNWDAFKKEAYGVYFTVHTFSYYLRGKPFVMETDHKNLLWMEASTSPIVIRWRIYLQSFVMWLRHIAGKINKLADMMTRMYPPDPQVIPATYEPEEESELVTVANLLLHMLVEL